MLAVIDLTHYNEMKNNVTNAAPGYRLITFQSIKVSSEHHHCYFFPAHSLISVQVNDRSLLELTTKINRGRKIVRNIDDVSVGLHQVASNVNAEPARQAITGCQLIDT